MSASRRAHDAWRWARRVGGKRALWRLKHEIYQTFIPTTLRGSLAGKPWPAPPVTLAYEAWRMQITGSHTHHVAQRFARGLPQPVEDATLHERLEALMQRGILELYGSREHVQRQGAPLDWLRGESSAPPGPWPLTHDPSTCLRGAFARKYGDIKDVWEVGRCGWVWLLMRGCGHGVASVQELSAYFHEQIEGFCEQHAGGRYSGPHFASNQECALRALRLCAGAALFTPRHARDWVRLERLLYAHGVYLARGIDFARHAVPNNHLIAEALAMRELAELFAHWPEAASWKSLANMLLREDITKQFYSTGEYCQASHTYHRFALEMLTWWRASEAASRTPDAALLERLDTLTHQSATMLRWWMVDASRGLLPNFGANDGAHFLPLSGALYEDFRPALASVLGEHHEETDREHVYWLLGHDLEEERVRANLDTTAFDGLFLKGLRHGPWQVALRTEEVLGTASQQDMGHVELWRGDQVVARDRGSLRYHDAKIFEAFAGQQGHNVVRFADEPAIRRVGRFMLSTPRAPVEAGTAPDRLWGLRGGYSKSVLGRMHREVCVTQERVVVRDRFLGVAHRVGVVRWQLGAPGEQEVEALPGGGVRWRTADDSAHVEVHVRFPRGATARAHRVLRQEHARRYAEARWMNVLEVEFVIDAAQGTANVTIETEFLYCASC